MPSLARAAAAYEPAGPPPMIRTCVCCCGCRVRSDRTQRADDLRAEGEKWKPCEGGRGTGSEFIRENMNRI